MKKQGLLVLVMILLVAMLWWGTVPVSRAERGDPPARLATPVPVTVAPGAATATATPTATPSPTPVYTPLPIPTFSLEPILPGLIEPRFRHRLSGAPFVSERFDR